MKFWPSEKYSLLIKKPKEEVIEKLRFNTESRNEVPSIHKNVNSCKQFYGYVLEDSFRIAPVLGYRNYFSPVIVGQVKEEDNDTVINVRMKLFEGTTVLMIFWFSFCAFFFLKTFSVFLEEPFRFNSLIPILMILLGYVFMSGGYWLYAKESKKRLAGIFGLS